MQSYAFSLLLGLETFIFEGFFATVSWKCQIFLLWFVLPAHKVPGSLLSHQSGLVSVFYSPLYK